MLDSILNAFINGLHRTIQWWLGEGNAAESLTQAISNRYGEGTPQPPGIVDEVGRRVELSLTAAGSYNQGVRPLRATVPVNPALPSVDPETGASVLYEYTAVARVQPEGYMSPTGDDAEYITLHHYSPRIMTPAALRQQLMTMAMRFRTARWKDSDRFVRARVEGGREAVSIEIVSVYRQR